MVLSKGSLCGKSDRSAALELGAVQAAPGGSSGMAKLCGEPREEVRKQESSAKLGV